jgi:hypothetical protein
VIARTPGQPALNELNEWCGVSGVVVHDAVNLKIREPTAARASRN